MGDGCKACEVDGVEELVDALELFFRDLFFLETSGDGVAVELGGWDAVFVG